MPEMNNILVGSLHFYSLGHVGFPPMYGAVHIVHRFSKEGKQQEKHLVSNRWWLENKEGWLAGGII